MPDLVRFPGYAGAVAPARSVDGLTMARFVLSEVDMPLGPEAHHLLLILLALVRDGYCTAPIAWLASRTGYAPPVVGRLLNDLVAEGFMSVAHLVSGPRYGFAGLGARAAVWAAAMHAEPGRDEAEDVDPADWPEEPRRNS